MFSRTWTAPRTVFVLVAGPLAHISVEYLVDDAESAVDDLFLELIVISHLGVDMNTLLEEHSDLLEG